MRLAPGSAPLRIGLLAVLLATPLVAVTADRISLRLTGASETDVRGEGNLRVESRIQFEFSEDGGPALESRGSWTAERSAGPRGLSRYTYKIEDLQVNADGAVSVRSFECVEGTLGGEALAANLCGGYRFGPNMIDDGGYGDDVSVAAHRSLEGFVATLFSWDGSELTVVIEPAGSIAATLNPIKKLTLKFESDTTVRTGQTPAQSP